MRETCFETGFSICCETERGNYLSIHNVWAPYGKSLAQDQEAH